MYIRALSEKLDLEDTLGAKINIKKLKLTVTAASAGNSARGVSAICKRTTINYLSAYSGICALIIIIIGIGPRARRALRRMRSCVTR